MCWYCGSPVNDPEPLGRSLRCEICGKDLKICRHCSFFLPGSRGDCSEPGAEPPAEKDRANFCDWFKLNPKYRNKTGGQQKEPAAAVSAKTAFDNLFK
jgi:hypothetical protein